MTIEQANEYFSSLPEGFAPAEELRAALTADVQKVQFVGVAGTAGKTAAAGLLAAILREAAFHVGFYRAGCEPLSARIAIGGVSVTRCCFVRLLRLSVPQSLCPVRRQSWRRLPAALVRQAVSWQWWNCRMPVWHRPCPICRSAPSRPSARTA